MGTHKRSAMYMFSSLKTAIFGGKKQNAVLSPQENFSSPACGNEFVDSPEKENLHPHEEQTQVARHLLRSKPAKWSLLMASPRRLPSGSWLQEQSTRLECLPSPPRGVLKALWWNVRWWSGCLRVP